MSEDPHNHDDVAVGDKIETTAADGEALFFTGKIETGASIVPGGNERFRGQGGGTAGLYKTGSKWSAIPAPKTSARCLFIYPGVTSPGWASLKAGASNEATYMSHGMAYVSSALKARGHLAWLLDMRSCRSWPDFARRLAEEEYDLVFLGFLSHDAFTAAGVVRVVKEVHPSRPLVVGGLHVSVCEDKVFPPDTLDEFWLKKDAPQQLRSFLEWKGEPVYDPKKFPKADCVVWNEAEIAACALAERVAAGEVIPDFVNAGNIPDLNETPHADRELFDTDIECQTPLLPFLPRPFYTITFGRGCPMKCSFAFDKDALIQTDLGEYSISRLATMIGDESFRTAPHGFDPQRIVSINSREYAGRMIEIDAGLVPRLCVTEEHHVLIQKSDRHLEEVEARALVVGDTMIGMDGEPFRVRSMSSRQHEGAVYDITTEPDHVLIAGGLLVKNCNIGVQLSSSSVRTINPDYFMDELEQLHARHGRIGSLMIHDDILLYPKWISEWCGKIRRRFGYVPMWMQMRADFVTKFPDLMREMAEAGMTWVSVGLESGSQRLLDFLSKQTTVEQNVRCCEILESLGVNVFGNWMLGLPTETPEDVKATADMMRRIRPGFHSASIYCDYPGTSLSRYLKKNNLLLPEWYTLSHYPWQRRIKGVDYELAMRTRGQVCSEIPNRPQKPKLWPANIAVT